MKTAPMMIKKEMTHGGLITGCHAGSRCCLKRFVSSGLFENGFSSLPKAEAVCDSCGPPPPEEEAAAPPPLIFDISTAADISFFVTVCGYKSICLLWLNDGSR